MPYFFESDATISRVFIRNQIRIIAIFLGFLVPLFSIEAQAAKRFEKDGIIIELQPAAIEIDGYRNFEVKIMNLAEAPRSVHAQFKLTTRLGDSAGSCTLFVQLQPGESKTRTKACKETALSRSFTFEIIKVYRMLIDPADEP